MRKQAVIANEVKQSMTSDSMDCRAALAVTESVEYNLANHGMKLHNCKDVFSLFTSETR
jgi:hypothetical protein